MVLAGHPSDQRQGQRLSMLTDESEEIEDKQSLGEWKAVVKSVAAFATARGGRIRVGVRPNGRAAGVKVGPGTLEDLANKIKSNTDPPQYPSMELKGEQHAAVIAVNVEESPVKPVWAFGRPYKRVGRTNQRLSASKTKRLMELTMGGTWDALPCRGFGSKDVLRKAARGFVRRTGQDASGSTENALENLSLLTPEGLCNAAALLFARNPQRFVPEALVKCARFLGTSSVEFLDEQTLEGNVLAQLDGALAFIKRNTRQQIVVTGRPERDVIPEYPDAAVREAVTNAICHREYTAPGTVQMRIYDDRLEVWNPGMLPPDLSVESLYREHPSRPRNPRLAAALHRARLIEHWGTGTLRIVRACEARGMHRPEFLSEMGTFIVRFRRATVAPEAVALAELNERQLRALEHIQAYKAISRREYAALLRVSARQALKDLTALVECGALVRQGKGSSTRYLLSDAWPLRE